MSFESFPQIPRLYKPMVVTEKIDGTNAQIKIEGRSLTAGSRNRALVTMASTRDGAVECWHGSDNYGFGRWCVENYEELLALGDGTHYGEWWGRGIQRGYGLDHKRFSLFAVHRWNEESPPPSCCHVVPVLGEVGDFPAVDRLVHQLMRTGSVAAPGFYQPEGAVVYHTAAGQLFKIPVDK